MPSCFTHSDFDRRCLPRITSKIILIATGGRPQRLDCEGATLAIVSDDVFRFLKRVDEPFDIALADPPYATGDAGRLVELFLEAPFAKELWLEHPFREQLPLPDDADTRRYGDTALTTLLSSR